MAAVRRYAIANSEPSGLARGMFKNGAIALLVTLLVGILMGAFLATAKIGEDPNHWIFRQVSYQAIHYVGIAAFAFAAITLVFGVTKFIRRMNRAAGSPETMTPDKARILMALKRTAAEIATMSRHREVSIDSEAIPNSQRMGWIHLAIMYGFLGLLLATTLDYLFLELLPLHLSVFWPARILGTVAGASLLWGVSAATLRRLRKADASVERTQLADGWALAFLLILAMTGFWLEIAVTFGLTSPVNDLVLLVHAAMAMEFVLLLAFTKMAHVIYRPLALFQYYLRIPMEK
jgi:hypothetical protein